MIVEITENVGCMCDIILTDVSGRKLKMINNNGNTKTTIDISEYPEGMYFISITNKHHIHTQKIIKQ